MTTSVSPVTTSLTPLVPVQASSAPAAVSAPAIAFNPLAPQQDIFASTQPQQPKKGWMTWGIGAGINIIKRAWNGVRNVINMFMPGQIGRTLRDTAMWTAGLSVFSFFLTGPLHLPAIPLYALASLGFDAAGRFIAGMWHNPNKPNVGHIAQAQSNQLGFMTPEQRKALGI